MFDCNLSIAFISITLPGNSSNFDYDSSQANFLRICGLRQMDNSGAMNLFSKVYRSASASIPWRILFNKAMKV